MHYFTPGPVFYAKYIILPPNLSIFRQSIISPPDPYVLRKMQYYTPSHIFLPNASFCPHTYISFAEGIILPADVYFWPNALF